MDKTELVLAAYTASTGNIRDIQPLIRLLLQPVDVQQAAIRGWLDVARQERQAQLASFDAAAIESKGRLEAIIADLVEAVADPLVDPVIP